MVQLSIKLIFEAGTVQKSPEQLIFAGKTAFLEFLELFLEISTLVLSDFLHKDAY